MSSDISVNATRVNNPIAGVPTLNFVQIDTMSVAEAAYYGGEQPYFRYNLYIRGLFPLQQEDLLTDTVNIDPKTNTFKKYRIINDPEQFPDQHMEVVADRYRGT